MCSYITLAQAAKLAPSRPSSNSVWRWCRKGIKARNGQREYLGHVRVGGRIYTTAADVHEFFKKLADADQEYFVEDHESRDRPKDRSPSARDKAIAGAEKTTGTTNATNPIMSQFLSRFMLSLLLLGNLAATTAIRPPMVMRRLLHESSFFP